MQVPLPGLYLINWMSPVTSAPERSYWQSEIARGKAGSRRQCGVDRRGGAARTVTGGAFSALANILVRNRAVGATEGGRHHGHLVGNGKIHGIDSRGAVVGVAAGQLLGPESGLGTVQRPARCGTAVRRPWLRRRPRSAVAPVRRRSGRRPRPSPRRRSGPASSLRPGRRWRPAPCLLRSRRFSRRIALPLRPRTVTARAEHPGQGVGGVRDGDGGIAGSCRRADTREVKPKDRPG